jgi:exodeoxyribonuclease VII large subunit
VGHETDFTISDFVADLRAPTPSAAAELATPDVGELKDTLKAFKGYLNTTVTRRLDKEQALIDRLASSPKLTAPKTLLEPYCQRLDGVQHALSLAVDRLLEKNSASWENLSGRLNAYSPLGVLGRGYAIAKKDGAVIRSAEQLQVGDSFELILSHGKATCMVENKEE